MKGCFIIFSFTQTLSAVITFLIDEISNSLRLLSWKLDSGQPLLCIFASQRKKPWLSSWTRSSVRQEVGPVNPTKPGKEIESCQIEVSDQKDRSQTCMIGTFSFSNCVVSLLHQFPIIFTTVKPLERPSFEAFAPTSWMRNLRIPW